MKSQINKMSVQTIIVDDNAAVLFLHDLMIRESGFSDNIKSFSGAEPALSFLEAQNSENSECVIFLDINMPGMSGWGFLKHLEKSEINFGKRIHVVMVTSSVNSSDRKLANNFKYVIDFIEKPLNLHVCEKLKEHERLKHLFTHSE